MAKFFLKLPLLFPALVALVVLSSVAGGAPRKKRAATEPAEPAAPAATATPAPTAPGELPLSARGAIVIDAFSGATLYEKNSTVPLFPASTTKIMTALLIIEAGDLDRPVECTLEDSRVGESSLELQAGQRYPRRQMLYGLMLKSANDVAHALGRDNAGSAEAFAEKMTARAQELGATSTIFRNANGLHDRAHATSPRDLALITRAAMQQPFFRQIVATQSYDWQAASGPRQLLNHNKLLKLFPGCTGVKTGYTNPAQHTLVTAALRGGREVIAVVMYDTKQGKWDDSMILLSYGLEQAAAGRASAEN